MMFISDRDSENYISYEQIVPLLKPGMTAKMLAHAILEKAGLSPEDYDVVSKEKYVPWALLTEVIKQGLLIVKIEDSPQAQYGVGKRIIQ